MHRRRRRPSETGWQVSIVVTGANRVRVIPPGSARHHPCKWTRRRRKRRRRQRWRQRKLRSRIRQLPDAALRERPALRHRPLGGARAAALRGHDARSDAARPSATAVTGLVESIGSGYRALLAQPRPAVHDATGGGLRRHNHLRRASLRGRTIRQVAGNGAAAEGRQERGFLPSFFLAFLLHFLASGDCRRTIRQVAPAPVPV